MRTFAGALLALVALSSPAFADAGVDNGWQWREGASCPFTDGPGADSLPDCREETIVPVQAGTRYALFGAAGCHTIAFLDADGNAIEEPPACDPRGTVPATAIGARITIRSSTHVPQVATQQTTGPSHWTYVDGL